MRTRGGLPTAAPLASLTPISEEGQEIPLTGRQVLKKAWSSPSCQKERSCIGLEEATTTELYPTTAELCTNNTISCGHNGEVFFILLPDINEHEEQL
jgi:hypothetical protein